MKFKTIYLTRAIIVSNVLFVLPLLLSYLAPFVDPAQFWPIAFMGLVYPFLLVINLIYVIYWLISQPMYALLSGAAILLGWNIILNCFGFNFRSDPVLKQRPINNLRVMTYNVHDFLNVVKSDTLTYQKILNLIKSQDPDIITFEEFCSRNAYFRFCDSLKKNMNNGYYYFEPFIKTKNDSTGLAIFSKLPIINHNIIKLSNEETDNQGIYVDVKSKAGLLRVYCFHLQSVMLSPPDYIFVRKHVLFDKHNAHHTFKKFKAAYITRGQQALLIRQEAKKSPYPYIFTGDFNDTPNSYAVHQMADGLTNAFSQKGIGLGLPIMPASRSFKLII